MQYFAFIDASKIRLEKMISQYAMQIIEAVSILMPIIFLLYFHENIEAKFTFLVFSYLLLMGLGSVSQWISLVLNMATHPADNSLSGALVSLEFIGFVRVAVYFIMAPGLIFWLYRWQIAKNN
ncbi:hypothetical protein [Chromobacterium sp.]|uniref:hypothetical protein n=1 Tax=Chromobacterium sp. TaxID=306190 RepID=UPI0035B238B4